MNSHEFSLGTVGVREEDGRQWIYLNCSNGHGVVSRFNKIDTLMGINPSDCITLIVIADYQDY